MTIVQHPAERKHPFNTVRLAQLALAKVEVHIAWEVALARPPLPPGAALLYPSDTARDLASLPVDERPTHLVVIDGTWPEARSLYRHNPWMHELPHVGLTPEAPSTYRIRQEPSAHCLSTIESIAAALRLCEPNTPDLDRVLDGFHALIDGQLARRATVPPRRRALRRGGPTLRAQLRDRWEDVVVLYAETTLGPPSEVLQLAAVRPATGEVFDRVLRVARPPHDEVLARMGLTVDVREDPLLHEVSAEWSRFRRERDLLVVWSWREAETTLKTLGDASHVHRLRAVYGNLQRGASGRAHEVLTHEGLSPLPVHAQGRAAYRLGVAAALARWLGQSLPTARSGPDEAAP